MEYKRPLVIKSPLTSEFSVEDLRPLASDAGVATVVNENAYKLSPVGYSKTEDAGVATLINHNANADKSTPVETYKQQQTEEDAYSDEDDSLSQTSTIEYAFSDEGFSSKLEFDEGDSTSKDYDEDEQSAIVSDKVTKWVASWEEEESGPQTFPPCTWINVYAYFSKKKHYGGYGVILRNVLGRPIAALANFSEDGISFFYQVLMGINAGVALAKKLELPDLCVRCNSFKVPSMFDHAHYCSKCQHACDPDSICEDCKRNFKIKGCNMQLELPLALELGCQKLEDLSSSWGYAAHYVAKMEKKKRLQVGKKEQRFAPNDGPREILPGKFPQRLKTILWGEAYVMTRGWTMAMEVV